MAGDIEEVKQKTDIVSIIGEHVTLKRAGRHFKGLCPFHAEKSPSFTVSPELQIFKCFGCGESGDVFTFLDKYEGMEFYESLKFLADKAGITLKKSLGFEKSDKENLYSINELVAKFYHYILTKHPTGKEALKYLTEDRGINLSTIESFQLGYSPESSTIFQGFLVSKKKVNPLDLEKLGIAYKRGSQLIDRFRGRVIFPLMDQRGNICGFSGRIMPKDNNAELAKYINTPETAIYHKSELLYGLSIVKKDIKQLKQAVIVEGELDMISSWQSGLRNVVAIKGSALTLEQARILSRFCTKVVLALDSDFAGDAASKRGISVLQEFGFDISIAQFGEYKDPDEVARKDPTLLFSGIDNAVNVWDFIIAALFKKFEESSGSNKSHISREVIPVLFEISDSIVRAHYTNLVANRLNVPIEAVNAEIQKYQQSKKGDQVPQIATNRENQMPKDSEASLHDKWQERLFTLVLVNKDPSEITALVEENLITNIVLVKIATLFKDASINKKGITFAEFVSNLPPELQKKAQDLVLAELSDDILNIQKESSELKKRLRKKSLEDQMADVLKEIRMKELQDDSKEDDLLDLQNRFRDIAQKLKKLELDK